MKRILNIIFLLLIVAIIIMEIFPPINQLILIIKNVFIFWVLAWAIYTLTTYLSKTLIKRFSLSGIKETFVLIGKVAIFSLLLVSVGVFQFNSFKFSQTPFAEGCKYYDQYNNLIYQSEFYGNTPELNIYAQDEFNLGFEVEEQLMLEDIRTTIGADQDIQLSHAKLDMYRLTTVDIQYNIDHKIISLNYKVSQYNNTLSETHNQTQYYSFNQIISNSYVDQFESNVNEAVYQNRFDYIITEQLTHHQFVSEDYATIRYYIEDGYESENDTLYHLVKEYENDEGNLVNEEIASINYIRHNEVYEYLITSINHGDTTSNKTIDIVFREKNISYNYRESLNSSVSISQTTYSEFSSYKNISTIRSKEFLYSGETTSYEVYSFRVLKQINGNFLIQKQLNLYQQIDDTVYGHKVTYLKYTDQSYIDYLRYGENIKDLRGDPYFEYNPGLTSGLLYKLYDIEYQLANNNITYNTFYSNFAFLIFE